MRRSTSVRSRGFRLGRIAGIEVVADLSLLVLGVLLVASLFLDLRNVSPASSPETLLIAATIGGAVFIASVLAHEVSHSVLALRIGLPVQRIRLFIFGGVSEIEKEAENPRDEFTIAVAGPVASAAIGVVLWLGAQLAPDSWVLAGRLGTVLGVVNLLLAAFNLLPGFPLDGGRVLRALLWRRWERARATQVAIGAGRVLALTLVVVGLWLLLSRRDLSGLWTIAVGWFLYQTALSAQARERLLVRVAGLDVASLMRPVTEAVAGDTRIAEVMAFYQVGPELEPVPVLVEGRIRGILAEKEISGLSETDRRVAKASEVMTSIGPADVVDADRTLEDFLSTEHATSRRVLVIRQGRVVGVVTDREIDRLLNR